MAHLKENIEKLKGMEVVGDEEEPDEDSFNVLKLDFNYSEISSNVEINTLYSKEGEVMSKFANILMAIGWQECIEDSMNFIIIT